MKSTFVAAAACGLLLSGAVQAAELKVLVLERGERGLHRAVSAVRESVRPQDRHHLGRHQRHQEEDRGGRGLRLVVIASPEMDAFIKDGKVAAGSKVDLVKSGVGVAVKAGAPKPDFSSAEALKKTLVAAKSVGYSQGPSGVYMRSLFEKMGIADAGQSQGQGGDARRSGRNRGPQRRSRDRLSAGQRADPRKGHRLPRPPARATSSGSPTFSGGIHAQSKEQAAAKALQSFLTAPERAPDPEEARAVSRASMIAAARLLRGERARQLRERERQRRARLRPASAAVRTATAAPRAPAAATARAPRPLRNSRYCGLARQRVAARRRSPHRPARPAA